MSLPTFAAVATLARASLVGAEFGLRGVNGSERLARRVVDDLRGDVALGEMDGETRALGRSSDLLAKAPMAELAFVGGCGHGLLDGFAFLAADLFSGVADSLALVGFRRVERRGYPRPSGRRDACQRLRL